MPEFTDDELREHDKTVREEERAQVEKSVIGDTTWKSLDAMKESASNANSRINEAVNSQRTAESRITDLDNEVSGLKTKLSDASSNQLPPKKDDPPPKKDDDEVEKLDAKAILESMTDEESDALDKITNSNKKLKEALSVGGDEAMAKVLIDFRSMVPAKPKENVFGSYKKKPGENVSEISDILKEAVVSFTDRKQGRSSRNPNRNRSVIPQDGEDDDDDTTPKPVRGGGGMDEFRRTEDE